MGWLLWAISNDPWLGSNLVLKGGNCLRKIYFADTRFSDDLDFTALQLDAEQGFRRRLGIICDMVSDASGIEFDRDRLVVMEKETPLSSCKALDGRVYFKGMADDSSVTMRVKFDVSDYERIVLPTPRLPIIHEYADSDALNCAVLTYSLEEVLAEKLRSWIQRTRARDLFDVVKIVHSDAVPISKKQLLSVFLQKTIFKGILAAGRDELLVDDKFQSIEDTWLQTIICPVNSLVLAANAIKLFRDFVSALFEPKIVNAIGASLLPSRDYGYNIRSGIREIIVSAGRSRKLLRMRYQGKDRDIEPYSLKYKMTNKGYGAEYFYGFDRTRGQTIKSFFLNGIQSATALPTNYVPRWIVEF